MKKSTFIIIGLLSVMYVTAQLNPQSKKITERYFPDADSIENVTPALQKKRGYTDYDELTSFLNSLKASHPGYVTIEYIGETQKGYNIPLIRLTNSGSDNEKIKVWMQGGLHGNEPASTEGLLYLLHTLLNNSSYTYLLDKIDLKVVPMANIDGYLKQSRYAANGLDLNRDQTKLMAPESIVLKQAFSDFNPQVGVDFHEFNPYRRDFAKMGSFGVAALYDIMFLYSGNLNIPENMRKATDSLFVENARKELDKNSLRYHDYMATATYSGETHFTLGSIHARSSATSYALTNTISSLIEVRGVHLGRTSFKRRIATTFSIAASYLKTAYDNSDQIKNEIVKAQNCATKSVVKSKRKVYKDTIQVIDLDTYDLMDLEITVRDALQSEPKLVREIPQAYLIDKECSELIKKLNVLGIKTNTLEEDTEYTVKGYLVTEFDNKDEPYEKMIRQSVKTEFIEKTIKFPKGTFIIPTNQKNAPLLTEILEPEATNSFVSFGVLETGLNKELPIYRLSKKN
ncbi:M14 family metallopeptidase [Abyssalbus ytuae]|uniref:M14 family metallocarboxypeptidase n=1 Tax=Abyssalbus ytuae TaxID=2926907 RepID=A0A9E6ZLI1_9FLAO|nr:M14 family metallocarboxypeptidase [Abyssalbus ytuae]UOB16475.1 M14 family metallocarboxypeptidase [Abyssalbus ytuae]